jgi:hypothetical protein
MDVGYLLEEFIYIHSFLFYFKPELFFIKKNVHVINKYGQVLGMRPVITELMLNVNSDLSLLAADVQEIEYISPQINRAVNKQLYLYCYGEKDTFYDKNQDRNSSDFA